MKKYFFFAAVALMLAACSSDNDMLTESAVQNPEPTQVTLMFSPYQMEAMTRAATAISTLVTRLDVWLTDGTTVQDIHQTSSDDSFGQLSITLDKRKTYTLTAVAHKCSAAATLADGIVSFPDTKVLQTFFYQQTFTPAEVTTLSCEMQRIVGQFKLQTTDAVPDEVAKVIVSTPQAPTQWSIADMAGITPQDYAVTFSPVNRNAETGTAAFTIYVIGSDEEHTRTITVTAYDSEDNVIQTRTFADVPMKNGYRTTYSGFFFSDAPFTTTFTVGDWNDYDTMEF